jgi:starch synthase
MKIFVTGTRGIPDIPGGVEKHCQELYPLIVAQGHVVIVATRSPYVTDRVHSWKGVHLLNIFAPRMKSLEAITHTFFAVIKARFVNPDILHIHAVGPGLMVPLARMLGLKVVFTNHGPDYDRQKWGGLAKKMLRLGEYVGCRFANQVIVISREIAGIIRKRCGRESSLIYNGVQIPERSENKYFLEQKGIIPNNYILALGRFVPEKGLHDLLEAFKHIEGNCQLVIAGDADHATKYSRNLKRMSAENERVILTGFITGEELNQVFSHARLFVMPSYHEGLPISLLEAMSYDLPVLVSDIPANREINLRRERFFKCGDIFELREKLLLLLDKGLPEEEMKEYQRQIVEKYNWREIADQTVNVYEKALRKRD